MLLSCKLPEGAARALPVSPYPVPSETKVKAHFVVHQKPEESGWGPWLGGTWSKWVDGEVVGYRDMAGRETQVGSFCSRYGTDDVLLLWQPGTYDDLSHMLFRPQPTAGSSGGPIVDEESGAVVGVMLGTRMDSAAEGVQGWGVPAEAIFSASEKIFSLCVAKPESVDVCIAWIGGQVLNLEKCLMTDSEEMAQIHKMPHSI